MASVRKHCGFCGARLKRAKKQKQEGANPPSSLSTRQADYAAPMIGRRFGRLVVAKLATIKPRKWFCVCDCGGSKVVNGDSLRRGFTHSCGCLQGERRREASRATTV
jgi:hypothetical protein